MKVSYLKARDFRNVREAELYFDDGVNVLCGENGQGKTNALECLYLFSRGRSFRAGGETEMIRFGQSGFAAEIGFSTADRDHTLTWRCYEGQHKRTHNGYEVKKIGEFVGLFRAVLFSPDHLTLVKGAPESRREFLNVALSQFDREYISLYAKYRRVLDNRNTLLRFAQKNLYFDPAEFSAWTEQLASLAAKIATKRIAYVERLGRYAEAALSLLSRGTEELSLRYENGLEGQGEDPIREAYLDAFEREKNHEIAAGYSLFGVHRDDLSLYINGTDARVYASQGQQRSVVLALKEAEGEVVREVCGEYPVYLFDDVLSELDEKRRAFVFEKAAGRQMIITSCEKDPIDAARVIFVKDGAYERA